MVRNPTNGSDGSKLASEASGNSYAHAGNLPINLSTLSKSEKKTVLSSLASALVERFNFAQHFGFDSFNSLRNFFTALGYKENLTISDYRDRYRRGGIARTIVRCMPREMWSGGVSVVESDNPEESTKFEKDCETLFKNLSVVSRFMKADILAGLGRYSVILIGVSESSSDLSQPLPKLRGPDDVIYLKQFAEDNAKIGKLVSDTRDKRFGEPEYYDINFGAVSPEGLPIATNQSQVHWTRVIHLAQDTLESDYIGTPTLESVWNLLDDLYKVTGGGAEAAWRRMDPGLHIALDPEYDHDDTTNEELQDKLDEYRHALRRDIPTSGVDITPLNAAVDKYGANVDPIIEQIAGTIEIPKRKFVGTEAGELGSSQDEENVDKKADIRRSEFGEPVLREFIDRMIEYRGVSKPTFGEYHFQWGEKSTELTETEKGELVQTLANANKAQSEAEGKVILTSEEIRDTVYGLEPLPEPEPEEEEEEIEEEVEIEEDNEKEEIEQTEGTETEPSESTPQEIAA